MELDDELFDVLGGLPFVDEHHLVDTRAVHVQHGLPDVGLEGLANLLPHLVEVSVALLEQLVVVESDGASPDALYLN